MSDGDSVQYNAIKSLEIIEYFNYYDQWKKRVEMKLDALKSKK